METKFSASFLKLFISLKIIFDFIDMILNIELSFISFLHLLFFMLLTIIFISKMMRFLKIKRNLLFSHLVSTHMITNWLTIQNKFWLILTLLLLFLFRGFITFNCCKLFFNYFSCISIITYLKLGKYLSNWMAL